MSTGPSRRRDRLGGLSRVEGRAWGGFLRTHAELTRKMNAELEQEHGLPLRSYDVLRQLALSREGGLRMAELANRVLLTRPGLTGAVRRLEEEGLVRRAPTSEDGRGAIACLTEDGERRLDEVHATHLSSIRRSFVDRLSGDELEVLARIWARILQADSPAVEAEVTDQED